ncbi:exosortase B [Methylibium sp.]|uniref:exosortase B n=1 Tax=Methylibium sp. TaxID=2067992 RepID=UPI0025D3F842|nr:exosortase B [Methylibium sp.]
MARGTQAMSARAIAALGMPTRWTAWQAHLLPRGADPWLLAGLAGGFFLLYLPTYADLARWVWDRDEQAHGPIILGVSAWLLWRLRHPLAVLDGRAAPVAGGLVLGSGLLLYVFGRTQAIGMLETASQILVLAGLLLLFKGWAALRLAWFPLFFLIFMVPLPSALVAAATTPLKAAVSYVAEELLHLMGYPVARSGVILSVGQYQMLVADACAGLNSMLTLEALGLLYMKLMGHTSALRNTLLAMLVIPIAFVANIVRVMVLVLVTFHLGDEAGQGFVHDFAGLVLFMVGLSLILAADQMLGWLRPRPRLAATAERPA